MPTIAGQQRGDQHLSPKELGVFEGVKPAQLDIGELMEPLVDKKRNSCKRQGADAKSNEATVSGRIHLSDDGHRSHSDKRGEGGSRREKQDPHHERRLGLQLVGFINLEMADDGLPPIPFAMVDEVRRRVLRLFAFLRGSCNRAGAHGLQEARCVVSG
jgi:hypothetical protein